MWLSGDYLHVDPCVTVGPGRRRLCSHAPYHAATLLNADGKPVYTVHQLRHTRGTELTEDGQRLDSVQRVVGHTDPRSTQLYADMAEYEVRQALETGQ